MLALRHQAFSYERVPEARALEPKKTTKEWHTGSQLRDIYHAEGVLRWFEQKHALLSEAFSNYINVDSFGMKTLTKSENTWNGQAGGRTTDTAAHRALVLTGQMTSFNHCALGAVADWLHRTLGGLAPPDPGYRRLDIRPQPGGSLTHVCARCRTPYGLAWCGWRIADGHIDDELYADPAAWNTVASCLLGSAPDIAGHVWNVLRENGGTTLRQVVSSEPSADAICVSLAAALIGLRL